MPKRKLITTFSKTIESMLQNSVQTATIDKENAVQYANKTNRKYIESIIEKLILDGSSVEGFHSLEQLYQLNQKGHSCLLLFEHYSTFDVPVLFYLLKKQYNMGERITNNIIALATRTLNEYNDIVRAFAEAYTRVLIFTVKLLNELEKDPVKKDEWKQAIEYNKFALSKMHELRKNNIVFIFASGTRYRPGVPETKKPIKQIDSFIRQFEYMIVGGIAGLVLEVNPNGSMEQEYIKKDVMTFSLSPVLSCSEFRQKVFDISPHKDRKTAIADAVDKELQKYHNLAQKKHDKIIQLFSSIDLFDIEKENI